MRKTRLLQQASVLMLLLFIIATSNAATPSVSKIEQKGKVTVLTVSSTNLQPQVALINFAGAHTMKMPEPLNMVPEPSDISRNTKQAFKGTPGFSAGKAGSGQENPMSIPLSNSIDVNDGISTQEYGSFNHPFTTSRVEAKKGRTSKEYPFSASGKLYFNIGTSTFVCSASLIKPGIIVTAAHCVAGYGTSTFYRNWVYVPALTDRFTPNAPYGIYGVTGAAVMTSWINGTDGCNVVCPNDVAVLVAAPLNGKYPGARTGFLAYGWNNFGFTSFAGLNATEITQLGYPVGLSKGLNMMRTDSLGYTITDAEWFNNIQIGSRMTGGSSGGPWIINFGIDPIATPDVPGLGAKKNVVVAVTSWGYVSPNPKVQGASPFTSGNIVPLVNTFCPSPACP